MFKIKQVITDNKVKLRKLLYLTDEKTMFKVAG